MNRRVRRVEQRGAPRAIGMTARAIRKGVTMGPCEINKANIRAKPKGGMILVEENGSMSAMITTGPPKALKMQ